MNMWNEQYLQATRMLAFAHAADQAAYHAIPLEGKTFWAARPVDCWPRVESYEAWRRARLVLIEAEKTVIEVLRWRCVAIRLGLPMNSIAPKYANLLAPPYVEQRMPDTLIDQADAGAAGSGREPAGSKAASGHTPLH